MTIAEIYARNDVPWTDALRSIGFRRSDPVVCEDRTTVTMWGGPVEVRVSTPRDRDCRVARWLQRHGDGVAELTLPVNAPLAAYQRALAAGAEPDAQACSVIVADVVHHFVSPPARPPQPGPFEGLDHIALAVPADDVYALVSLYVAAFGAAWVPLEPVYIGDQGMDSGVLRMPGLVVTVVSPTPGKAPGQVDGFLKAHGGPGIQHVAFRVRDIITRVLESSVAGARFLPTPHTYFDALPARSGMTPGELGLPDLRVTEVLYDRDSEGELRQIFTASPVPPVFLELIERNGSGGFGKGNITALYEAQMRNQQ